MAFLVADKTTTVNGVKLNEKIIPLNAKSKNGNYFRDQRKLKPRYVTIHNTWTPTGYPQGWELIE